MCAGRDVTYAGRSSSACECDKAVALGAMKVRQAQFMLVGVRRWIRRAW